MQIVYSPTHERHDPPFEMLHGRPEPYLESPSRVAHILAALAGADVGPIVPPRDAGLDPILTIHDRAYIDFLHTIYPRWVSAGGAPDGVIPSTMAVRALTGRPRGAFGEAGYYLFDTSCPILPATFEAACASAQVALTAAALVAEGAPVAYALCRPPGHHAHRDMGGGYCYLNNAAIAAHALGGAGRVAVLDIDYHAGNGTEAIFYERDDVLVISIHADPHEEYPYYLGFADERGAGLGVGYTLNIPLPFGTGDAAFLAALDEALAAIRAAGVARLVVSAGFDTFRDDPLGHFTLTTPVYTEIGRRIAALGLPTAIVQEGGYAIAALGENVVSFLRGWQPA